jgi:hypothetical protein
VIGGRYGTQSSEDASHSITQAELRSALEKDIQVFIFIDASVDAEFATWKANRASKFADKMQFPTVDNIKVFEFIEEIRGPHRNNAISTFTSISQIMDYLRIQFAGLFQRSLQESRRAAEIGVVHELKSISATLEQVTRFLTAERSGVNDPVEGILQTNHPAFRRFAELTSTRYRVFFTVKSELDAWLKSLGWTTVAKEMLDRDSIGEWAHRRNDDMRYIKLTNEIFNGDGQLQSFTDDVWQDKWITIQVEHDE